MSEVRSLDSAHVIRKGHYFVSKKGRDKAYTTALHHARLFKDRRTAQAEACSNEVVMRLTGLFGLHHH